MKAYATSFLMAAMKFRKKVQKSNFRANIFFVVIKITLKFSQNIYYFGEYATDFNKRGLE